MSRFYGTVQGSRGQATRCGNNGSGITTEAAAWGGCIEVQVHEDLFDPKWDRFVIRMMPWQSNGDAILIATGTIGDSDSIRIEDTLLKRVIEREKKEHPLVIEETTDDWDEYEKTG
jgi:hypothetical protein